MKQPKKLTRNQKILLTSNSLDWKEWMLVEETELYLQIIHKKTGAIKQLTKARKKRRLVEAIEEF